ncbi:Metallo-dependent phosphatase [Coprinopsis marcescibilis]|uniref:Metallo-dependent phosphatase n=1 Tax=Coprinopsis marcescibilis TaxID=230819 RepID=A0A5C3KPC8_COPMA|nr:Metallo-dependent phosphatase [Coprinopsis marcescibilis]
MDKRGDPGPNQEFEGINPTVLPSADAVVHLDYDPATLQPLGEMGYVTDGGEQWTRFVCISDTHSRSFNVPFGDVLLHSGDLTKLGTVRDFTATMEWLYSLPHKVKIIIAGNHDLTLHKDYYQDSWMRWHNKPEDYKKIIELVTGERAKKAGIVYLENTSCTFSVGPGRRDWTAYGSPWSPYFCDWAFNYKPDKAEELVSSFPNADLLLTHGPPEHVFDFTRTKEHVGCPSLASHLASGRLRPRIHIFGHIHESRGANIHSWDAKDGESRPPRVQNRFYGVENSKNWFRDSGRDEGEEILMQLEQDEDVEERNANIDLQRTVFVNAANDPTGPGAWVDLRKTKHGGRNFQPIVVDLKD